VRRGLAIYAAAAYAFLHLPLATLIVFSFNASRFTLWEGFSLRWYQAVFTDADMADAARNSVVIAIVSTAIATVAGTLTAYALWKRGSRLVSGSLYLSLVTPEIVTGISLLAFFQWAFRWLHWQLGLYTVILAHVSFSIAYVAIVVAARLRTLDPALEEAAMDLGANGFQTFRDITLPLISTSVVAGCMLAFALSFDEVIVTTFTAGAQSTLPIWIFGQIRHGVLLPEVNVVVSFVILVTIIPVVVAARLTGGGAARVPAAR